MSAQIRLATIEDASVLVNVINRAYIAEAPFVHGPRTDYQSIVERLSSPHTWFLLAEQEGMDGIRRISGCVCLDCDWSRGHIGLLSVEPDLQKRGLGAQLLRSAEDLCRTKPGCSQVELEVVSLREDLFPF